MTRWQFAAGVIGLLLSTPAHADGVSRWQPLIDQAAAHCGVPADWIARVMRAESGGRTTLDGRPTTSHAGAMGLMQLMPGTWAEMRAALSLGSDPHDPRDNIVAGACYLRRMYDRFGYPGAFAAYNAGPARYADHLAKRRTLPAETVTYLAAVTGAPPGLPTPHVMSPITAPALFFVRAAAPETPVAEDRRPPPPSAPASLFIKLTAADDANR